MRSRLWTRLTGGLLLAVVFSAGCGGGGAANPDGDFNTCATDTRAVPYHAGMSATSQTGVFTVKLLTSSPGPPIKGQNDWMVEIDETATGLPLAGVDVTVSPFMPDHQHPTTRPVVVTPTGDGTYDFNPVYLFMPGYWEVRLTVSAPTVASGAPDEAMLPICIP